MEMKMANLTREIKAQNKHTQKILLFMAQSILV